MRIISGSTAVKHKTIKGIIQKIYSNVRRGNYFPTIKDKEKSMPHPLYLVIEDEKGERSSPLYLSVFLMLVHKVHPKEGQVVRVEFDKSCGIGATDITKIEIL